MTKTIKVFLVGHVSLDQTQLIYDLTKIPKDTRETIIRMQSALLDEKMGWQHVTISAPEKKRSTGYRSQEAHVRGHCQSISEQAKSHKWNPDQVMELMKGLAAASGRNYPPPEWYKGVPVYASNATLTMSQEAALIETIHQFSDENNFWLIEYTEERNPRPYKTRGGRTLKEMMKIEPELNPEYKQEFFEALA